MRELKKLFEGVKHPSVHIFRERIAGFSAEEQRAYYHKAFHLALCGFDGHSKRYQKFLYQLVDAHRQEFSDFLRKTTILGLLLYQLSDKELFRKVVYRMEGTSQRAEASRKDLAFALILSFDYDLKISSLSQYMKTDVLDSADWAEVILKLRVES